MGGEVSHIGNSILKEKYKKNQHINEKNNLKLYSINLLILGSF